MHPAAHLSHRGSAKFCSLIAEGLTMKAVASILHISPRTAEAHKDEIMQVLGVETTAALIQYAIRLKLVAE